MDGARVLHRRDHRTLRLPVRRDAHDGTGAGERRRCLPEACDELVFFDAVHGAAMANEEDGHRLGGVKRLRKAVEFM